MDKLQIQAWWSKDVVGHSISTSGARHDFDLNSVITFLLAEADEKDRLVMVNESLRERIAALEVLKDDS